ncbi:MAG: hemolysin III [Paraglaciecola sp.]|jgi:hemolysin III
MSQAASIVKPYSVVEEWLHSLTHGLGFIAALIGLFVLLQRADGMLAQSASVIYGVSMMLMFLSSTMYHAISKPEYKLLLKVIDHCAIYFLIAGTYTPLMLLTIGGGVGTAGLVLIWMIAIVGVSFKCFARARFPRLSLVTYLLMGWLAVFFIYPLYQALPDEGMWLLLVGGLCYTVGVLFYIAKKYKYTHAVWHVFVAGGCASHFFLIYDYVV